MKIALLGYGKEGQATEKYFKSHFNNVEIDIFARKIGKLFDIGIFWIWNKGNHVIVRADVAAYFVPVIRGGALQVGSDIGSENVAFRGIDTAVGVTLHVSVAAYNTDMAVIFIITGKNVARQKLGVGFVNTLCRIVGLKGNRGGGSAVYLHTA